MILKKKITLLAGMLFLLSAGLQAQRGTLPADEKAEQLLGLAKKYLGTQNYKEASQTLLLAAQRPENQLTTTVIYYLGLAWLYQGEYENARRRLEELLREYPDSKYSEDARYHLGLVNLESLHVNDKERGLDLMLKLSDEASDSKLRADALNAAKHYLFEVYDVKFLDLYFLFVKENYRVLVQEAICSQHDKKGNSRQILANLKAWEEEGQKLSPYLADLKKKYTANGGGRSLAGGEVHVAIFLGFNLQMCDTARIVPGKSMRALEIYEGVRFALDQSQGEPGPHIVIRLWDTRNDSNYVRNQLSDLEEFNPDFIIGDISTNPAIVLGRWADANKVTQLIPRNPLDELYSDSKSVFLFHPSHQVQGRAMAEYAVNVLNLKKILVLNDYSYNTDQRSKAFTERAKELGATVTEKRVLPKFDAAIKGIPNSVKNEGYSGIYSPLENEENQGLLMSELSLNRVKTRVMGGDEWEKFITIDSDSKTEQLLTYTTYYSEANDSAAITEFRYSFIEEYGLPPQEYAVMGYDMMNYLLELITHSEGKPLADQIRQRESYHGMHTDIWFNGKQSNQKANIVQYQDGRLVKLN